MHEKSKRIKYIRVLEKFFKRNMSLLKLDNFDFELYKERTLKNYEEMKKAQSVDLNSPYLVALKNYIDLVLRSIEHHSESFENEKEMLLKEANLLQKEKNRTSYKKDKHKNQNFYDGY
ncbi:hypothetical protein [Candidatus Marinarcus aquaticus]|uniref:Uncharacterized protein n=1 Tax=Candidatus Marinarcus aquaticus TaxID=2044504 RepID=A0A4Q0XTN5_9BACT|nr:hypothetical protein [Candidatus Marinarcus aquaticus]RXJ60245.1 hypothetical protein CRV04_04375 [Candidatus Marinarcus aquaticus]